MSEAGLSAASSSSSRASASGRMCTEEARCGIYLVTLLNEQPISVNANHPKIAARCIKVCRIHCKVGRAKDLDRRERNYRAVFGAENVVFERLATMTSIGPAERAVLEVLRPWRMRGPTGRLNEWLEGIEPAVVRRLVMEVLRESGAEDGTMRLLAVDRSIG